MAKCLIKEEINCGLKDTIDIRHHLIDSLYNHIDSLYKEIDTLQQEKVSLNVQTLERHVFFPSTCSSFHYTLRFTESLETNLE